MTQPRESSVPAEQAGQDWGDYHLVEEVGRGGMGVVFKARQRVANRVVALKVLRQGPLGEDETVRRFRNEAEIVAQLDHPAIVPLYEVVEGPRGVAFSMKYLEGGSLAEHLPRFASDARAAAQMVATVARAVHHAHQRGVLHRDLKPSNILLDNEGRPYVTDFGLARRVAMDGSLTQSGALVGTPNYMAPEQTSGRKAAVTTLTDVHGLGAVLYTLLAGRSPFQGDSLLETLAQIQQEDPVPPSQHGRPVDRDLETICMKSLAREPQARYVSPEALAEDLERWLAGKPILARPIGRLARTWRWCRRNPAGAALVGALVLAATVLAGSIGWIAANRQAQRAQVESRVREALVLAEPQLQAGNPRAPELLAAVRVADAQLASEFLPAVMREQVEQLRADQKMLAVLEDIRLEQAGTTATRFSLAPADPKYEAAFQEYGIEVDALSIPEAVARIQARRIAPHLVDALENWARARKSRRKGDASWRRLLDIADIADAQNPWRSRFREALAQEKGPDEWKRLIASAPSKELSAATFTLLGGLLDQTEFRTDRELINQLVTVLQEGQEMQPADFWLNHGLARALYCRQPPQLEEAIGFYRAAVALRPQSPGTHLNLGAALGEKRDLPAAIREFRKAVGLDAEAANAHFNLGTALAQKGEVNEAITELREAIRLRPDYLQAHNNLGNVLRMKGDLVEAVQEFRVAIHIEPGHHHLHNNLGNTLRQMGDLDRAGAAYTEAIRLKPDFAEAHLNLGAVLAEKEQRDEAIKEYRVAIQIQKDFPRAHFNLAIALKSNGEEDEAIREYQEALRLQPDYPEANCNLGQLLRDQGRFAEALTYLRRGHEQGLKRRWTYPSGDWVKKCERLLELDAKLSGGSKGEIQPTQPGDRLMLAQIYQRRRSLYLAATRLYTEAFAEQPTLANDLNARPRFEAACAAALAAAGQGKDANTIDASERPRLRKQALDWLHAELAAYRQVLATRPDKVASEVRQLMQHWQQDEDFASVRGAEALARLPEAERSAWEKLWEDVRALQREAASRLNR
jgi:serine/threonine-protein kinase